MSDLLILVILLALFGGVGPWWPYSRGWGWGPGGLIGLILLVLLIRALINLGNVRRLP